MLLGAAKHGRPTASIQDPRHLLGAGCPSCTSHSNTGERRKSVPFNDLPIPRAQNILQKMRARQSAKPWAWHPSSFQHNTTQQRVEADASVYTTLRENGTAPASGGRGPASKVRTSFEDAHHFSKVRILENPEDSFEDAHPFPRCARKVRTFAERWPGASRSSWVGHTLSVPESTRRRPLDPGASKA